MARRNDRLVGATAVGEATSQEPGTGPRWFNPLSWFRSPSGDLLPPDPASLVPGAVPLSQYEGPVVLGVNEALRVSALWRAGNLIADSLADVPLESWRVGSWTADARSRNVLAEYAGVPGVLFQPEADFGRQTTIQRAVWSLLIWGNLYLKVDRSLSSDPETVDQVWVLDPRRMTVFRDERGFRRFRYLRPDERFVDFGINEIIHVPWVSWPGTDVGAGVLGAFGDAGLRMGLALSSYMRGALTDGGVPSVVITVDKPNLSEAEANQLKSSWMAKLGGRRVPAVVPGMVSVQPIGVDSKLTEHAADLWNTLALEVANMTGVPVTYLNGAVPGSSLDYTNLESRQRDLVMGLQPWANRLEEAFSRCLPRTQRAQFDLDLLARGETQTRYNAYATAISSGWLTVDEVRRQENLPPLADTAANPPQVNGAGGAVVNFPSTKENVTGQQKGPQIMQSNGSPGSTAVGG